MSSTFLRSAFLGFLLIFAACPRVVAEEKTQDKVMDRTITVSASGQVSAEPDEARIASGVTSDAKTAREALSVNSNAMKNVIAELKAKGIDAKDIQTTQFNVEPVYVYPQDGQPPQITGFRVANSVTILVRQIDHLGEVMDQMVTAGANQMNSISFGLSKAETLKDDARKEAIANALRRAKLYAASAGAEVGEIVQISEDVTYSAPQPVAFAGVKTVSPDVVPVERGTQQIEARVTATWRLK